MTFRSAAASRVHAGTMLMNANEFGVSATAEKHGGCRWVPLAPAVGTEIRRGRGTHDEIYLLVPPTCKWSLLLLEIPWAEQAGLCAQQRSLLQSRRWVVFFCCFQPPKLSFLSTDCERCWLSLKQHGQTHAERLSSPMKGWVGVLAQSWVWLVLSVSFSLTSLWHISDYLPLLCAKSLQDMYWMSGAKQSF